MKRILSTKTFDADTLQHALDMGLEVTCADFIEIAPLPFDLSVIDTTIYNVVVFTSSNAVNIFLQHKDSRRLLEDKLIYATSGKTSRELEENNITVQCMGIDSASLAASLTGSGNVQGVLHVCGKEKLSTLQKALKAAGMKYEPLEVYETLQREVVVQEGYDAIMFYSPSTVESYFKMNCLHPSMLACAIGSTTAAALEAKGVGNIVKALFPDPLAMLVVISEYYKTHTTNV